MGRCRKAACSAEVPDNEHLCPSCGTPGEPPNVKMARAEAGALAPRVAAARKVPAGKVSALAAFEKSLASSRAVISLDFDFLHKLLGSDSALYVAYQEQVDGGARLRALPENDRHRTAVEALLFGSWGGSLLYAALSLDGRGLRSYGPASIQLTEVAVEDRASVLEENSYGFVDRHKILPGKPLPLGYRAPWPARNDVAVAKLSGSIKASMKTKDHAALLLDSRGRASDDFVEVHVFGRLNRHAIDRVTILDPPSDPLDKVRMKAAKTLAVAQGIRWSQ